MTIVKYAKYTQTAALARAKAKVGKSNAVGMCLAEVAAIFGVGGVGDYDGDGHATALDYWKKAVAKGKVVKTSDPARVPAGAMAFMDTHYGHVFVGAGSSYAYSTDRPVNGKWGRVTIRSIEAAWGKKLLGYVLVDGNGVTLTDPPPPDPRPKAGAPWFKIATFNMKAPSLTRTGAHAWSKRRDAQVVSIDAIAADVLCVQEAGSGDDLAWLDKHLAPALSRVPGGGNWRHIYVSPLCEVVASGSFELTPLYKGDTKEAAWAVLKISNTHALVTSFHLEEDSATAADPYRAKQIVSLYLQAAAVAADRGVDSSRIFHAGDANSVKLVAKTLAPLGFVPADVNAWSTKNTLFATINNWVNKAKGGHSDYIFVPALRPVLSWTQKVNAIISDHNAVVAVIAAIA